MNRKLVYVCVFLLRIRRPPRSTRTVIPFPYTTLFRSELFGAPDIDAKAVIAEMQRLAPQWLGGCKLRDIWFQPTFHKHVGELSSGVHIHADGPWYDDDAFQPWRDRKSTRLNSSH